MNDEVGISIFNRIAKNVFHSCGYCLASSLITINNFIFVLEKDIN